MKFTIYNNNFLPTDRISDITKRVNHMFDFMCDLLCQFAREGFDEYHIPWLTFLVRIMSIHSF